MNLIITRKRHTIEKCKLCIALFIFSIIGLCMIRDPNLNDQDQSSSWRQIVAALFDQDKYKELIKLQRFLKHWSEPHIKEESVFADVSLKGIDANGSTAFNNSPVQLATYVLREFSELQNDNRMLQRYLFERLKTTSKLTKITTINLLKETVHKIKSINDVQEIKVPKEAIVPFRIIYPKHFWKGNQLPLLTATAAGRLGNIMGEYATLYALHRIYNVSATIHPTMRKSLSKNFPNLSIKENLSDEDCQNSSLWYDVFKEGNAVTYGSLELAAAGLLGPRLFNSKDTPIVLHLFHFISEEIKKEFIFSNKLQKQAVAFLNSVRSEAITKNTIKDGNLTFIGFHVRRTDYERHLKIRFNGRLPGNTYFMAAMDYYRRRFPRPLFVVVSDNTTFVQESIIGKQKDVYISFGKAPSEDMAILANCNHSINTYGTFGFWGNYLARGEVVYPMDSQLNIQNRPRFSSYNFQELKMSNFIPITF